MMGWISKTTLGPMPRGLDRWSLQKKVILLPLAIKVLAEARFGLGSRLSRCKRSGGMADASDGR